MAEKHRYVAFLRGINVGGHHKVPMADLRAEMGKLKCENVITILNTGNIIFESAISREDELENTIASHLEAVFGFAIPTLVRNIEAIERLLAQDPFKDVEVTKDIRCYISFLKKEAETNLPAPWSTEDGSFSILSIQDRAIISVLDLAVTKTTKGMEVLERTYGKDITTRNWNTIKRIEKKL